MRDKILDFLDGETLVYTPKRDKIWPLLLGIAIAVIGFVALYLASFAEGAARFVP